MVRKEKKTEGCEFKKTEGEVCKKTEKEKDTFNNNNSRRKLADVGRSYADVLNGKKAMWRRKGKEPVTNFEGEGSRVGGYDEEVEEKKIIVMIDENEWNVYKEEQQVLREKVNNLEILCRNLEEEVKKWSMRDVINKVEEREENDIVEELIEEASEVGVLENEGEEEDRVSETIWEKEEDQSDRRGEMLGGDGGELYEEESIYREEEGKKDDNVVVEDEIEGSTDGTDGVFFCNKTKDNSLCNNKYEKKSRGNILKTVSCSMKLNHIGSCHTSFILRRKKKILGPCIGVYREELQKLFRPNPVVNNEEACTSDTISMDIEEGEEGQRKKLLGDKEACKDLEEANLTIEVGRKVGVLFNPDLSSVIEKLVHMDNRKEEKTK